MTSGTKTILWVVGVFVAGVALIFLLGKGTGGTSLSLEADKVHPLDYVKGNASSTVVLIEYSDFQCPACRTYYPLMRQVITEYGARIAVVYRHFPLIGIHFNAEFAARASEAARQQGKFWEMHDLLFEKQEEWSDQSDVLTYFTNYAELIGISVDQFKIDYDSEDTKNFVKAQRNYGVKIGINATPSFFINGDKIENPRSMEDFRAAIDSYLK